MRRLRKLKVSTKYQVMTIAVELERQNAATGTWDEFAFRSEEPARAELHNALHTMATHLLAICEFPVEWQYQISIQGVTVTYNDDDIQGVVISGRRELMKSNAPMILNSPHVSREPYSEGTEGMSLFPPGCGDDLDLLEQAAIDYVDGKRLQRELEFESEDEHDPNPNDTAAELVEMNR